MADGSGATVKGLLFDFDNTLVTTTKSDMKALEKVKERLYKDFTQENVEIIAIKYVELFAKGSIDPEGKIDPHCWRTRLWRQAIECASKNDDNPKAKDIYNLWRSARLEGITLDKEIEDLLRDLRQNYKLAIVTNSDPIIQREKLQSCGITKYFDAIVISGEEPHSKPHPSIFLKACNDIDVLPGECIMIGDNPNHDILGGINAGLLATVWVKKESQQELTLSDPRPDFIVDTVLELPRILETLNQ